MPRWVKARRGGAGVMIITSFDSRHQIGRRTEQAKAKFDPRVAPRMGARESPQECPRERPQECPQG